MRPPMRARFDQGHAVAGVLQDARGGQPGEARANDHDPLCRLGAQGLTAQTQRPRRPKADKQPPPEPECAHGSPASQLAIDAQSEAIRRTNAATAGVSASKSSC